MSTFLNIYKATLVFIFSCCIASQLSAQCSLTKTTANNQVKTETPETYQYISTGSEYYGVSIKTISVLKNNKQNLYTYIVYSGSKLNFIPFNFNFDFNDGTTTAGKLIFLQVKKTDNKKTKTNIYKLILADSNINYLKNAALKAVRISSKTGSSVIIPVNDPLFMQSQITCLQNAAL